MNESILLNPRPSYGSIYRFDISLSRNRNSLELANAKWANEELTELAHCVLSFLLPILKNHEKFIRAFCPFPLDVAQSLDHVLRFTSVEIEEKSMCIGAIKTMHIESSTPSTE